MNKQINLKTLVLALGLLSLSGLAQAEFVRGMNQQQVATEISAQITTGASLGKIAKGAHEAGLNLAQVTETLIKTGQKPADVVKAVVSVNPEAAESVTAVAVTAAPADQAAEIAAAAVAAAPGKAAVITKAATAAAPAQSKAVTTAVLTVPGVNPAEVLSATASGGDSSSKGQGSERRVQARARAPFAVPPSSPPGAGGGHAASRS